LRDAEGGHFWIDLLKPDVVHEDGSMSVMPFSRVGLTYDELKPFFGETVTLAKFCEGRRGYNPRLINNERLVMKFLNS